MKKIILAMIGLTILSIWIYSCKKEQTENECKTCESNSTLKTISTFGKEIQYKDYQLKIDALNYINSAQKNTNLMNMIEELNLRDLVGNATIVSVVLFCDEDINKVNKIDRSVVSGVLLYLSDGKSFYTKLVNTKLNNYVLSEYSIETSIMSYNDIKSIVSANLLNSKILTAVHILNNEAKYYNKSLPRFSYKLKQIPQVHLKIPNTCTYGGPCSGQTGSCCVIKIPQNATNDQFATATCNGCCIAYIYDILDNAIVNGLTSALSFIYTPDNGEINNFKHSFLATTTNGEDYILKLDYLTDRFNEYGSTPDLQYCIYSVSFFHNTLLPIIEKLENPNIDQNLILINNEEKSLIISYLNSFKQFFNNDTLSIQIIDSFISEINSKSNKSINEVKSLLF